MRAPSLNSVRGAALLPLLCLFLAPGLAIAVHPLVPEASADDADFPVPAVLQPNVDLWKRVYLEVTTNGGFLHDTEHPGVIYEKLHFGSEKREQRRQSQIKARRTYWRGVLAQLRRRGSARSDDERSASALLERALGHKPTAADYGRAERRIRFQLGQRDKFRAGLLRSGAYEDAMRAVFRSEGLPEDLAYLPHVESSFNLQAYSKYGAAGVWQFMRSTGRLYMQVDYDVDERLDPMIATRAAARLLKHNHQALGTWPLAVTAYNHGTAGMKRAKRQLGTSDFGKIAQRYRSRSFGFASRNFYAQFLAARQIMRDWSSYFGPLQRDEPEPVDEITLPYYADVESLREHLGLAPEVIRQYNPSLRPPIFRSAKHIPKGFVLRLPAGTVTPNPETWLARMPSEQRHARQVRARYYQVRRGDNLGGIARSHGTSIDALVAQNSLPSRHRIFPGQVLEIPEPGSRTSPRAPSLISSAHAATAVKPKVKTPAAPEPVAPPVMVPLSPAASTAPAAEPLGPPAPLPELPDDSPWRRIEGDVVIVDSLETLGHFADWLQIPTQRLRDLNDLRPGGALAMGARLRLDFSRVTAETLLERRIEFHKGIEEDFLASYRITGTTDHTTERGENLWVIANQRYSVPAWLIHRFNPTVDLSNLAPGTALRIPLIEPTSG